MLCQTWPHTFQLEERRFLLGSCTGMETQADSQGAVPAVDDSIPLPGARWLSHTGRLCNGSAIIQPPVLSLPPVAHFCARATHVHIYRCTEHLGRKTQESGGSFPWETGDTEGAYSSLYCSIVPFGILCIY